MLGLKDFKIIVRDLGLLLMLVGLTMSVPIVLSLIYPDSYGTFDDFAIIGALMVAIGAACYFSIGDSGEMSLKHAIALMVLFWPLAGLFSAIPLYTYGVAPTFLDAYFEGLSGWTTTGLTTIGVNADSFPHSINMWRGMLQYMGGLGVILISIVVLAQARTGSESISLVASEFAPGERIRPGIWSTAKILVTLFLSFLFICSLILLIAGMDLFDSIFYAMTGLGTGGFSAYSDSIAHFDSGIIEIATVIVMIIGSTNFAIHLTILSGNYREILRNIETRTFIVFVTLFTTIGAIWLWSATSTSSGAALFDSFYHIVSGMTTTGWTIVPNGDMPAAFPAFFIFLITLCMIMGGNSVSTAGGIRQVRIALMIKSIWWHIRRTLSPRTVVFPRSYHHIVKKTVTDSRMMDIYMFVSIYLLTLLISTLVLMAHGYNLDNSYFESASALTSGGMSFGITSTAAEDGVKIMLMIDMWVGRIEIIPVLMFFASFSRRFK